jgi:hypothetical protein
MNRGVPSTAGLRRLHVPSGARRSSSPGYARHDGRIHVSHNTGGFRGRELDSCWWGAANRIAAVGGSTTYDTALSDNDTRVAQLGAQLGSGAATLNMEVPGHSTAEHIILVSLLASDFTPTVVIYYVGWTDIANSHVATHHPAPRS